MSFAARSLVEALPHPAAITDAAGLVLVANDRWRPAGTAEGDVVTGTGQDCPAHHALPNLIRDARAGSSVTRECRCAAGPGSATVRVAGLESTCGAQRRLITVESTVAALAIPEPAPALTAPGTGPALAAAGTGPALAAAGTVPALAAAGTGPALAGTGTALLGNPAGAGSPTGAASAGPGPALRPLPPGRVLLAEDDDVNRTVLQRMIAVLGVDCDVVRDGAAAIAAMLGPDRYDLVLMDMQMPGVDGPEAARRVRAAGYRNPILALTATTLPEDREECLAAGMDGYLGKPVTLPELRQALEPYLSAAPQQPPAPTPSPGAADVLSLQQLYDLEDQLEGRELVAMTVGTFLAELDGRRKAMADALATGDNHRLGAIAHTLKSSSALLGGQPLADACARVERMAAASADPGILDVAVSEVDRAATATASAMAEYLNA
ncbi:response regulator [Actinoplanes derwentensis]|uniref:CheY chemotaxis protein or a CheY-like REC (Receiver) domain n=1 Tax=Actinoplanes derwentensis TaxID=113562 RepID=A0A1H2ALJ5_9ACTN|nr:response regulator [Actinoplanes derwentensis]GID89301.1 hypothetical protein Ade03nite_82250 [Actinoplanes derwentensis]SDT46905.1 CheY chemotaxis protein or a CheY-like REC (receiver) domain [Actinoplanes derwentensis]